MNAPVGLARKLGLGLVCFYGLGTILGAGIYVLVGKVSAAAGLYAPLAFAFAAFIAFFTALSYARLVAIYPHCAGPVKYVFEAFANKSLSTLVGWLIVMTGVVSAATIANGFVGYLNVFIDMQAWLAIILLVFALTMVAIWGIAESMWISAAMTIIEIAGLLFVIYVAGDVLLTPPKPVPDYFIIDSFSALFGVFAGAFIAFYAFIGFEDMVNVVEEVKNPGFNLPVGIFIVIVVSSILYILIAIIAVASLSIEQLAATDAPLALLLKGKSELSSNAIALISLFAIVNGALVQIIMGSRVLYGMSREGMAPAIMADVHSGTRTPIKTTLIVAALVLLFALWLPLVSLAKLTSFIVLIIFFLVNLSLWRIKRIKQDDYARTMNTVNFPITGMLLCLFMLLFQIYELLS